jgi:GT2 family glycosyltransferase
VAIPTRGLEPLLQVCLDRLAAAVARAAESHPLAATAVVVDNASPSPIVHEPSRPELPVHVVRFDAHHTFAACCNEAVRRFPSDLVLLLNNDVLLHPEALRGMVRGLRDDPSAAVCGTRLVFPDGTIQHAGVVFAPGGRGPVHRARGRRSELVSRETLRLQAVTGACALVRAEAWRACGGLDESYPFGLEDVDFCLRVGLNGSAVICVQEVDSLHFESMTPGRVALDVPSRALFMERWKERTTLDAGTTD